MGASPRLRRARNAFTSHVFESTAAVVWIFVGAAFLTDPEHTGLHSPLAHQVGWLAWGWSLLYILGGLGVLHGLLTSDTFGPRVAGLTLLAAGTLMQGVAGVVYGAEIRTANYFVYALAFALRGRVVMKVVSRAAPPPR